VSGRDGWRALADGRWGDARAAFESALRSELSPEALEGLSWAAWWLDDADAVFDARERALRLYKKRGEAASAARMATWLAADHLDFRGALAVANGWLRRARRLLEDSELGRDHGWLAFHEGYLAFGQGRTETALELAAQAAEIGRRFDVPDLQMLGLALRGVLLVTCAEVEEGMGCLDEATATALEGEATVPISAAWACCFLVTACEAVRDYPRAFEWCDRIAEFSGRYGSTYMLGFCRTHYASVHLWRGDWEAAEDAFEAALAAYAQSRPSFVVGVRVGLAELRRRQGRLDEAEELLADASGISATLCRAHVALDRGDAKRSVRLAERILRRVPEPHRLERAPALELLVRALARSGDEAAAAASLEELRALERVVGTTPLSAAADLADGLLSASAGDHEGAVQLLEEAVDGFVTSGAPFEAAQARLEAATSLMALGRVDAAAREIRVALDKLEGLGAEGEALRARKLLDECAEERPLHGLTPREEEVLRLVADGLTNRRIAKRLVVSEHTVHRHVTNILRKLDVPSRAAAAAQAVRSGLARQ
jgi:DNA-binding NarL/FixJ family response regulator